ncbi:unnamed protein product [Microthlaspi erraticum]|uniref:Integrase catalytic domain-containing protein n=1 Tax=Microthlaspi erraticum TaxID=1685480 RepID=A0A6D2JYQ5_9BRAS|nr:unnamed protein product [Microthlaspi erraticum]
MEGRKFSGHSAGIRKYRESSFKSSFVFVVIMVIRRKVTRRTNGTTSSARKTTTPDDRDSSPEPASPLTFTISPDSVHSPYYLTSGDNLGHSIISEVLDGSNYDNWRIAMNITLDAKNKLAFIDGSIARPSESDQLFRIWSRCNSMVKSWILNSVSKEIYKSILRFNDASEIWKDLSTCFHITSLPRSYQLSQQIWSLNQGSMDLSTYYTKLKTLWDELDGTSCEKTQIIMKKNVPALSEIYNLLDQDHSQRTILPVHNATAFQVTVPDASPASVNAAQTNYQPQKQNQRVCTHCGYTGHTVDTCFKIHGYPPNFKHKNQKSVPEKPSSTNKPSQQSRPVVAQVAIPSVDTVPEKFTQLSKDQIQGVIDYFNAQLHSSVNQLSDDTQLPGGTITTLPGMAFSSSTLHFVGALRATGSVLNSESWIIDSGATHHVCHDKRLFSMLSENVHSSVTLPTGSGVQITGIGSIKLSEYMILKNVLYIPDFRLNLLSISQLIKDLGYRVSFDSVSCVIQDPIKGLMIGQGEEVANLYVLDVEFGLQQSSQHSSFLCNAVVDSELWHNRLGHPSDFKTDFVTDMIENQYGCRVRGVRSDNAPELKFVDLYKAKGIKAFHSCPETPEQKSVVERKHQHILNVARALMFQAKVPLEHWGDCVLNAVFLINRLPTPLLKNKTPFDMLTGKKADYKGLRVFGCLAFCSTLQRDETSFSLEHDPAHVVFHEEIFPFAKDVREPFPDVFDSMPDSSSSSSPTTLDNVIPAVEIDGVAPVVENDVPRADSSTEESVHRDERAEIPYPLAYYLSYDELSEDYKAYVCSVNIHSEPSSFAQAKKFDEWLAAMNEELIALEKT